MPRQNPSRSLTGIACARERARFRQVDSAYPLYLRVRDGRTYAGLPAACQFTRTLCCFSRRLIPKVVKPANAWRLLSELGARDDGQNQRNHDRREISIKW